MRTAVDSSVLLYVLASGREPILIPATLSMTLYPRSACDSMPFLARLPELRVSFGGLFACVIRILGTDLSRTSWSAPMLFIRLTLC